jgi:hypothetical protein
MPVLQVVESLGQFGFGERSPPEYQLSQFFTVVVVLPKHDFLPRFQF